MSAFICKAGVSESSGRDMMLGRSKQAQLAGDWADPICGGTVVHQPGFGVCKPTTNTIKLDAKRI